ncbi:hypothetical protein M408DRAFT_302295 [Serendipita vermifera MAFF 305830]|uniref:Uncharacterized protein n=1 Tax=Serendipita vermifera MAFF 305830 TaxID=933852 RepID=A0A0C2WWC3_SERVB|nr:hypothetical protein M408DRAFT_302295 [Serendipita vermifera MAFF 305830]
MITNLSSNAPSQSSTSLTGIRTQHPLVVTPKSMSSHSFATHYSVYRRPHSHRARCSRSKCPLSSTTRVSVRVGMSD